MQNKVKSSEKNKKNIRILPGFRISLILTLVWLGLFVVIPMIALVLKAFETGLTGFFDQILTKRVLSAFGLSFYTAAISAFANGVIGLVIAWSLVRYSFPGQKIIDGLIDLPFALPTAVAGIALTSLYSQNGWIGSILDIVGIKVAYAPLGIIISLSFVGIPFVIRSVQPVLMEAQKELEEAARSLGASPFTIFRRILWPQILPALFTGISLSFARALGEYGSIVFISGNLPFRTEIVPLLIMTKLEQFKYADASAIALVFLIISFVIMSSVNICHLRMVRKYNA